MGAPWTIGAANVKRNDYVMGEPKVKLRKIAGTICGEMKDNRVCSKHGPVAEVFHWPGVRADDNFYMKATLNGPWAFFVNGHYFATRFPDDGSDLCACKVVFNNSYAWYDWGDLEPALWPPAYWADDLEWVLEWLYSGASLGVGYFTCQDFPVWIEWPDSSTLIFSGHGMMGEASGWPFDEGY